MTSPILALARGDGRDARDVLLARDLLRLGLEVLNDGLDRLLDAPLETHRVGPCRDVLETLADHRLSEDRRGRRAVAGDVVRRGRDHSRTSWAPWFSKTSSTSIYREQS